MNLSEQGGSDGQPLQSELKQMTNRLTKFIKSYNKEFVKMKTVIKTLSERNEYLEEQLRIEK